ncbi:hypothetical protein WA026_011307 [Henosepilachna vigintioctopunctata]|uniref:Uncharacterized protein n=1 Tax=Henosepilachna vigintioctopunctata TaxID=420089 RepID=A0AAW1U6B7_9CUCU
MNILKFSCCYKNNASFHHWKKYLKEVDVNILTYRLEPTDSSHFHLIRLHSAAMLFLLDSIEIHELQLRQPHDVHDRLDYSGKYKFLQFCNECL